MVDPIARSLDRGAAGRQIQGTAGTEEAIKHAGGSQSGIEQHRAAQGDACPQQWATRRQASGPGNHRQQIAVAARCIGATRKVASWISTAQVEAQHRKTGGLERHTHPPQALPGTGSTQAMEQQNQAFGVFFRLIEQGQQRPGSRRSTGQGWHGNFNRNPLIVGEIHLAQGVAQGLQVAADPGPALLKRRNPQPLPQLGVIHAAGHHFLPSPRSLSSTRRSPSTFLASPNSIEVLASSNRSFLMPE